MYINFMHLPWLEKLELCNVFIAKRSNHLGMPARMVGGTAMLAGTVGSDGWTTHFTLEHRCFEGDSCMFAHVRKLYIYIYTYIYIYI